VSAGSSLTTASAHVVCCHVRIRPVVLILVVSPLHLLRPLEGSVFQISQPVASLSKSPPLSAMLLSPIGLVVFGNCQHLSRCLSSCQIVCPPCALAGATRVLVTHQRHFLPACDRLLVLRDGRVIADGHFDQLQQLGLPELHLPAGMCHQSDAPPSNRTLKAGFAVPFQSAPLHAPIAD
jgi:hypothetical protein